MSKLTQNNFQKESYPNALQGLKFNGGAEHIEMDDSDRFNFSDSFSINVFVKPIQGGDASAMLVSFDDGNSTSPAATRGYVIFMSNVGVLPVVYFSVFDQDNIDLVLATTGGLSYSEIKYNNWVQITAVFESGVAVRLYANGRLLKTVSTAITQHRQQTITKLNIGGYKGTFNLSGEVAHVSMYSKVLTQGEISYLHNYIGLVPESAHANCVGYWDLQQRDNIDSTTLPVLSDNIVAHWKTDIVDVSSTIVAQPTVYTILDKFGGFDLSYTIGDNNTAGRYRENDGNFPYYLATDSATTARLNNTVISVAQPFSIIIVYRERQGGGDIDVTKLMASTNSNFSWNYNENDLDQSNNNIITAGGSSMGVDKVPNDGFFHVVQIDINSLNSEFFIDNVKSDNGNGTGVGVLDSIKLHELSGQFAFADMVVLNQIPTVTERTTLYNYLKNKYGL